MRGKVTILSIPTMLRRITPAYAGKSRSVEVWNMLNQDHPRLCGEKKNLRLAPTTAIGSPPPMRGKGPDKRRTALVQGITPAYAGKSNAGTSAINNRKDHPRLCGEKISWIISGMLMSGSPPPMRGKVHDTADKAKELGITPAYAGKSFAEWIDEQGEEDHPRLCGEKYPTAVSQVAGSRITPAYAGKRGQAQGAVRRQRDHPRLCGEKHGATWQSLTRPGSPPPMRGKVL